MPAKSESQRRLMVAAEHGATFPKAKKLRASMTKEQLHDFASSHPGKNLGKHLHSKGGGSVATRIRERVK
jgi:hypothetical protein